MSDTKVESSTHHGSAPPELTEGLIVACVGTTKGLWLFTSEDRSHWSRYGPFHMGSAVPAVLLYRNGDRVRLVSPAGDPFWGITIQYSDDLGATWKEAAQNPRFSEEDGVSLRSIWALEAHPDGTLYAGVEPANIFTSRDGGDTWQLMESLWRHPHRASWMPGAGGLCLHTIRFDPRNPERIFVAISTGGMYVSEDGGKTWEPRNRGVAASFLADPNPEYGQCVHKVAVSAKNPDRMYMQNHGGVYRSDDGGATWTARENGLPGNFGFPIVVHDHDPDTAYVIPLEDQEGKMSRWMFDGRAAVYRTRDGGESWHPLTRGLPQENAYFTVLRDGMTSDGADPLGIYFGTRSGHVYYSADEGEEWRLLADMLPPVLAVKVFRL